MPKKFDKKAAVSFALVHRSHEDERYFDPNANDSVFVEVHRGQKKIRQENKDQLAKEVSGIRSNEGQAALYGVTYDDSEYDYMQHMKDMDSSGTYVPKKNAVEPAQPDFALKELLGDANLPAKTVKYDYQKQQAVPDEISGFKPDLNEDVREALVALEDDAYLDAAQDVDDVDVFDELLGKKQKDITLQEYEREAEKHPVKRDEWDLDQFDESSEFDWEKDFKRFKNSQATNEWDSDDEFDEDEDDDQVGELPNLDTKNQKKSQSKKARRKKGAMTDTSGYSMSSSAMYRTEQMTIIDDRYDVMREKYEADDNVEEPGKFDFANERSDFKGLVDDFLDNYKLEKGRKFVKKNKEAERIQDAATTASRGKVALRKKMGKPTYSLKGLTYDMDGMRI